MTYMDSTQARAERMHALQHSWGFECGCSLCQAPARLVVLDERMAERAGHGGRETRA